MDEKLNVVYVLTNPAMPGLVKIGSTSQTDHATRVSQLYTTGVPVPFDIEYACKVSNHVEVEAALHTAFAPQRINQRREFFRIEPDQAIAILRLLNVDDVTEEVKADSEGIDEQDKQAAEQLRKRRSTMDFDTMDIPVNAILHSTKSRDIAIVVDSKKVKFREHSSISLTAATREVLEKDYDVRPALYWRYNGRLLKDIYEDTY